MGDTFGPERIFERFEHPSLKIEGSQIIIQVPKLFIGSYNPLTMVFSGEKRESRNRLSTPHSTARFRRRRSTRIELLIELTASPRLSSS